MGRTDVVKEEKEQVLNDTMLIMPPLAVFVAALVFFHTSEYALQCVFNRGEVSSRSLLLSWPYARSMGAAVVEYAVERAFLPTHWKESLALVSRAGLGLIVVGEVIRKLGIITAGRHFTHDVKREMREGHALVTHGIYSFIRHPGYAGFFIWSIGTQVLLINPMCTLLFVALTWVFFNERYAAEIECERMTSLTETAALTHQLCVSR